MVDKSGTVAIEDPIINRQYDNLEGPGKLINLKPILTYEDLKTAVNDFNNQKKNVKFSPINKDLLPSERSVKLPKPQQMTIACQTTPL